MHPFLFGDDVTLFGTEDVLLPALGVGNHFLVVEAEDDGSLRVGDFSFVQSLGDDGTGLCDFWGGGS